MQEEDGGPSSDVSQTVDSHLLYIALLNMIERGLNTERYWALGIEYFLIVYCRKISSLYVVYVMYLYILEVQCKKGHNFTIISLQN